MQEQDPHIVYDTTNASVLIPYMAFLENTFEQIKRS